MLERALDDSLAPPMSNGELAFEEPWQGRVFGMANALCDAGCFEWAEFQAKLIEAIRDWERSPEGEYESAPAEQETYYDHFLVALENLVKTKQLVIDGAIEARRLALAARPHGHDH